MKRNFLLRLSTGISIYLTCMLPLAQEQLSGEEVARRVYERDDGDFVRQKMTMELMTRSGSKRTRIATLVRGEFIGVDKTRIHLHSPANLKGTGFLIFDYKQIARADDQWLYLPAMRRERRISASHRGDHFLGTDFTYEDIKERTRLSLSDFTFKRLSSETDTGSHLVRIEAIPKNGQISRTLGYGKITASVDTRTWMFHRLNYWDIGMNPLKTIELQEVAAINGIFTAQKITCHNIKTGHSTTFRFEEIDYTTLIDEATFSTAALRRGLK